MPDVEPLSYGDSVTIRHIGGCEQDVAFRGIFGNKHDQAYVAWPLAGEYKVRLDTGQLMPKSVSLWRVTPEFLERMRATARTERHDARERMKANRTGGLGR